MRLIATVPRIAGIGRSESSVELECLGRENTLRIVDHRGYPTTRHDVETDELL